jgi:hypothetical protein
LAALRLIASTAGEVGAVWFSWSSLIGQQRIPTARVIDVLLAVRRDGAAARRSSRGTDALHALFRRGSSSGVGLPALADTRIAA